MRRQNIILLITCLFLSIGAMAQSLRPVPQNIVGAKKAGLEFQLIDNLLQGDGKYNNAIQATKDKEDIQYFDYNREVAQTLLYNPKEYITVVLPYKDETGTAIILDLFNVSEQMNDYNVTTSSGRYENQEVRGQHFRGVVRGQEDNTSVAVLSLFENQMMGIVSLRDNGTINIGRTKDKQKHIVYNDNILKSSGGFGCAVEADGFDENSTLSDIYASLDPNIESNVEMIDKCIEIYFQVGYDIYQHFNQDVVAVEQFVIGLFQQVATIYMNEGIIVKMSEMYVWENSGSPTELLDFRILTPVFNGDLAHLLHFRTGTGGTSPSNAGGSAYVGELCDNAPYGRTDLFPAYEVYPNYSRQVKVLTHELGHNLGAVHTQVCTWNGNCTPLDGCETPQVLTNPFYGTFPCFETTCAQPPGGISNPGTIMSYCESNGNGGVVDLTLGFGPQPGYVIRTFVENLGTCVEACPVECPFSVIHFEDDIVNSGEYIVEGIIISTGDINTNANVAYNAGQVVILEDDFIADASNGSVFCALIDGCTPSANKQSTGLLIGEEEQVLSSLNATPNPTSGSLSLNYQAPKSVETLIEVRDLNGQSVYQSQIFSEKGKNQIDLNIQSVPVGVYIIVVTMEEEILYQKIVKQ